MTNFQSIAKDFISNKGWNLENGGIIQSITYRIPVSGKIFREINIEKELEEISVNTVHKTATIVYHGMQKEWALFGNTNSFFLKGKQYGEQIEYNTIVES